MAHDQQTIEQPERDCRHDEEVHCDNASCMVAKERLPSLRARAPPPRHILGDAGLADLDTELKKLSMDSRRSPQRVGDAHLADQPANFRQDSWSAAAVAGFPAPIRSETCTMPTDDGIGLHDRQRLDGIWHQTIQPNKDQAIHRTEGHSLRHMPSLDVKLMTKNQDLSFQRHPRPEQEDQHRPDQAVSFSHETEALRDSASRTSRIRFPTGTGDDADLLEKALQSANRQFAKGERNLLIVHPRLRLSIFPQFCRVPIERAFIGEDVIRIPLNPTTGGPAGPARTAFKQSGRFVKLWPEPRHTRISAVLCLSEYEEGGEVKPRALMVHNPNAEMPLPRGLAASLVRVAFGIPDESSESSLPPNHATYNVGRKMSVRIVATSRPPMIANAIGPQNTVGAIGIMPRTVDTAVSMIGRKRELLAPMAARQTSCPRPRSASIWPIRITAFLVIIPINARTPRIATKPSGLPDST